MDQNEIKFESLRDEFTFKRNLVSSIVWLHTEPVSQADTETPKDAAEDEVKVPKQLSGKQPDDVKQVVQVLMKGGKRVTLNAQLWSNDTFNGTSDLLGPCSIPIEEITELRLGKFASEATDVAYAEWVAVPARTPNMAGTQDGSTFGKTSKLVGTQVKDFSMRLLDGTEIQFSELNGKTVVLDFWATWNGQCVRSLPEMIEATNSFDPEQVVYIAVNQLEAPELIKNYVEQKQWKMAVGLDNGDIGEIFGANTIPYTVIVDPKGNIAFVNSGPTTDLNNKMVQAIEEIAGSDAVQK